jgi:hypothetical protein
MVDIWAYLRRSSKSISRDPTPYISSQQTTATAFTIMIEPASGSRSAQRNYECPWRW